MYVIPVLSNFLLVSSGYGTNGYTKNTEVLNLDSKDAQTPTYKNHSIGIAGATGGFIAGQFITCGGYTYGDPIKECYKIGTTNTSLHGTMKKKRQYAASIVLADKLWILGGSDENNILLNSTEYIFHDGRQEDGPGLPIAISRHTAIQINDTQFMILGGLISKIDYTEKTWIYSNGHWIDGPSLTKTISRHSVGKIRDSVTHKDYIVVTAGIHTYGNKKSTFLKDTKFLEVDGTAWEAGKFCKSNIFKSIELYQQLHSFIEGPDLPKDLEGHSSLTLGNELIVLFGKSRTGGLHFSSSVYKISCNNGIYSNWTELKVQLKTPRYQFVASFIPNELIDAQGTP